MLGAFILGTVAVYALGYVIGRPGRRARWELPGVLAPESCYAPERLRDLCKPVAFHRRALAPEECFSPGRLSQLQKPVYWNRSRCAPDSCFGPVRDPVFWNKSSVWAPASEFTPERLLELENRSPAYGADWSDVYCPEGRDLSYEALKNITASVSDVAKDGASAPEPVKS